MANLQKICVFDFETDGTDPLKCSPVQLAAIMVDPIKLEIIPDSEFNTYFKPDLLEQNQDYSYEDSDVLDFHAKVKGTDKNSVLSEWKKYPDQSKGWSSFISYLEIYHTRSTKKSCFSAPIAAGYNIFKFDLKIIERLSYKYNNLNKEGKSALFYPRDTLDLMNLVFYWFEGNNDLKNYTMDTLRAYLGIEQEGSHDAIKDVRDTANIIIRFLKLHRNLSKKVKFKRSFI
jgi:DNA polymerase III epsilon subunit-like protein